MEMVFERTDVVSVLNCVSGFKLRLIFLYDGGEKLVTHSAHWHVLKGDLYVQT